MKFPNAAKGVKRIYSAEILKLIAAIASIVMIVLGLLALSAASADASGVAIGSGIGTLLLALAVGVLSIIAFILNIVGITNASKDENNFRNALIALIIGIAASIVGGFFYSTNGVVYNICHLINSIASLFVTLSIIQGVINLADRLNRGDVSSKGSNIMKIILVIYVLMLIAELIVTILGGQTASVIAAVIALIAGVLSIVQYFMYISFLSKAKKMLAE